jgi:hypothetical protein
MKTTLFIGTALLTVGALATASSVHAQEPAKSSEEKATPARQQKPAAKPHKVWTDDDLGSLRRSGGLAISSTAAPGNGGASGSGAAPEAITSAAESAKTPAKQAGSSKAVPKDHPPLLSNPKTPADAEGMIAWEQRDIDSQQEYVDRLQTELEQAPPEKQEHLQRLIAERQQILADTRTEQQQLMAQKKTLERKSAGSDNVAATTQP